DVDAFVDRTICRAGLGMAVAERSPGDGALPLPGLVRALDGLRP
ncbi:MAG: hypothetical protein JWN08_725, partial [Frankiales bacterium]|nr:hypothetical protein [Frankiales bacterium]